MPFSYLLRRLKSVFHPLWVEPRFRLTARRQTAGRRLLIEPLEDRICLTVDLLVGSFNNASVKHYDGTTGEYLGDAIGSGGLANPVNEIFGPDGNLYVSSLGNSSVKRYNGATGQFIDDFVPSGLGGLNVPTGLMFSTDYLYVTSQGDNSVKRYDATTGAFIDNFVSPGSGGLSEAQRAVFGLDGNLYVSSGSTNNILRYDGTTGAFVDVFASGGGLAHPHGLLFQNGNLYVSSADTNSIKLYDGTTGAFLGDFVPPGSGGLNHPTDLIIGPDGYLYVSSWGNSSVLRYASDTGQFIDSFVPTGSGGLSGANQVTFFVAAQHHLVFSQEPSDTVAGQSMNPPVTVTIVDQFGNVVTGDNTDVVTLDIGNNPSGGTLSGTVGLTVTSGMATFTDLSIDKAGSGYTLVASSAGSTGATSSGFAITPAAADHLVFLQQPTDAAPGQPISPVIVEIVDQFGNVLSADNTDTVTITIGNNPGGGTLSGTLTLTVSNGRAEFDDLSIDLAGDGYTLHALTDGLTGADSDPFNITL
jgi:WD40 repeat protein